ncbi:MAG TPA: cupin domain-containing protein [Chloroflexota bacterium]|nr:cupin domain-containing protein [Chloroflexota bacterium]
MEQTAKSSGWIVDSSTGPEVPFLGMRHVIDGPEFDLGITILEGTLRPGQLVPPHTHSREDELAYVKSGSLTYWVDGSSSVATKGCYVLKPRGLAHAFWNHTDEDAAVAEFHVPGGQASYYDRLGALFGDRGLSDDKRQAKVAQLQSDFGITAHPDLIETLITDHGFRPTSR